VRPQKNKKRIDPRYFLNETTHRDVRDLIEEMGGPSKGITTQDEKKAEDIAPKIEQSPEVMAAIEKAAQDPKVQAAVEKALSQGDLAEGEFDTFTRPPKGDPDPMGAAYKARADRQGYGAAAATGVGIAGIAGALAPGALASIGAAAALTPAMLTLGLVGGPVLAGAALLIASKLAMEKHKNLAKAKGRGEAGQQSRMVGDFSDKEFEKIYPAKD